MDIMVDLETMGSAAGCPVLSIGAVAFTADGINREAMFCHHISLKDQMAKGLLPSGDTILWWINQSTEAQKALIEGQLKCDAPEQALDAFTRWYVAVGGTALWGNGADFDLPILGHLYDVYGMRKPWRYNAGRCQRTIFALIGRKPGDFGTKNLLAHDALADAVYQASEVAGAMRYLRDAQFTLTKQKAET